MNDNTSGQEVCETPPDPTFGVVSCNPEGGGGKTCTVSCQSGYRFQTQPAAQYRCDSNGNWSPSKDTIPNCVPGRLKCVSSRLREHEPQVCTGQVKLAR